MGTTWPKTWDFFKRGELYWFEFVSGGRRFRESTGVKNQRAAREIEAAYRTALAKGDVGITERKPIPAFRVAMDDFLKWSSRAHKKPGHARYKISSVALLKHFRDTALDKITPQEVERFKTTRSREHKTVRGEGNRVKTSKRLRPATVNRELACLKSPLQFPNQGGRTGTESGEPGQVSCGEQLADASAQLHGATELFIARVFRSPRRGNSDP